MAFFYDVINNRFSLLTKTFVLVLLCSFQLLKTLLTMHGILRVKTDLSLILFLRSCNLFISFFLVVPKMHAKMIHFNGDLRFFIIKFFFFFFFFFFCCCCCCCCFPCHLVFFSTFNRKSNFSGNFWVQKPDAAIFGQSMLSFLQSIHDSFYFLFLFRFFCSLA